MMTDDLENLISFIAGEGMIDRDKVTLDKSFAELGFDSLAHMQLIMDCEDLFEITIPEEIGNACLTVADLYAAIQGTAIKPCCYCGQKPLLKSAPTVVGMPEHYLECSNQIDCQGWPYTEPHPTRDLAIAAWNAITNPASSEI